MKILLSHGYFLQEDEKEQKIMKPYPPLGILYISAWLEKQQIENTIFDSTFSTKEEWKKYLLEFKPDLLCLYTNLMTKLNIIELVKWVKKEPGLVSTKIELGGPDITYNVKDYLNTGADFLVIGEGEKTVEELVHAIHNGNNFQHINGIAYKKENGQIIQTSPREKIKDIDTLPFPNRKSIDLNKYLVTWKQFHDKSSISVSTQRGCPYTCKWCSTAVYGQSYRRRSPKNVCDELEHLLKEYKPDSFWFVDDVFTVSHKWLKEFVNEVKSRNLKFKFECITRADRMNKEVINLLQESGCFRVWIGAESGSQKVIDAMDRRVDVNYVREMIIETRKAKMEAGTFIMLGYPGETEKEIEETVTHLQESNPDHFTITIAYPIKGTGLYEEIEEKQISKLKWDKSTDRNRDFERTYHRKYYNYAVKYVVNSVNGYKKKKLGKPYYKEFAKSTIAKAAMQWYKMAN